MLKTFFWIPGIPLGFLEKNVSPFGSAVCPASGKIYTNVQFYHIEEDIGLYIKDIGLYIKDIGLYIKDIGPKRDVIGELADAFRADGRVEFGLYHSLFEWFNPLYLQVETFSLFYLDSTYRIIIMFSGNCNKF